MTFSTQTPSLSVGWRNFPANTLYQALGQCRPAKKAGERWKSKKTREERRAEPVSVFSNTSIQPLQKKNPFCQNELLKCFTRSLCLFGVSAYVQPSGQRLKDPTTRWKLVIRSCMINKKIRFLLFNCNLWHSLR